MPDPAAWLAAIRAKPDDHLPRLVYADYLNERGESERAELIRVQCELAKIKCTCRDNGTILDAGPYGYGPRTFEPCDHCQRYALRRRERELLDEHGTRWRGSALSAADPRTIEWRRGFVEAVSLPAADWLAHADAVLAAHPVRAVEFTTPVIPGQVHRDDGSRYTLTPYLPAPQYVCRCEWKPGPFPAVADLLAAEWPGVSFRLPEFGRPPPADAHGAWERVRRNNRRELFELPADLRTFTTGADL